VSTIPTDVDVLPIVQSGTTDQATIAQLRVGVGGVIPNAIVADQTPTAATLTYLTNTSIPIPVGKLRIGSWFKWHLAYSKTAAGAGTRTYDVRLGIAGTTSDAALMTFTTVASTAAADDGYTDIVVVCKGPLSGSGLFRGDCSHGHRLATTGLLNQAQPQFAVNVSGTVDVTVANLIIGITTTSAASEVITYTMGSTEAHLL